MRTLLIAALASLVVLAGCAVVPPDRTTPTPTPVASTPAPAPTPTGLEVEPRLQVEVVASGLTHPWDVAFLPDGRALVTERGGRIVLLSSLAPGATVTRVPADLGDLYARGEGGLMGLALAPDFASSRIFVTCQTHAEDGRGVDVRLVRWQLAADGSRADRVQELVTGLPLAASGRHSGCLPTVAADGALVVGTGDSANPAASQSMVNLGGKTLRLNLLNGEPLPDNPFAAASGLQRYIYTYGHRNVQGVAVQPGTGTLFSVEHGTSVDDEVNVLRAGANYGWDPSQGGRVTTYDESVPMTDTNRFPDAVPAIWSSGPTIATSGATFLAGEAWGPWDGALAVAALKGSRLLVLTLDGETLAGQAVPAELAGTFGRLRAARLGPDGALYLTTSNGSDDKVLRVTNAARG